MGRSKLLLPFKGKRVIDIVLDNLLNSKTERVVIVARENDNDLLERIPDDDRISVTFNNAENADMFSSVVCGTRFFKDDTSSLMFFLGEHPLIDYKTINTIIDAFENNDNRIALPVYEKIKGHPVIIDNSLKNEIFSSQTHCLKDIMRKYEGEILEVEVECRGIAIDLDTEEDYKKLLEE